MPFTSITRDRENLKKSISQQLADEQAQKKWNPSFGRKALNFFPDAVKYTYGEKLPELLEPVTSKIGQGVSDFTTKNSLAFDPQYRENLNAQPGSGDPAYRIPLLEEFNNKDTSRERKEEIKAELKKAKIESSGDGFMGGLVGDANKKDIPFAGDVIETVYLGKVLLAYNKVKDGSGSDEDIQLLDDYYAEQERLSKKRESIGYKAGETIRGSAKFMTELAPVAISEFATLSLAPTGEAYVASKLAKKSAVKLLKDALKDKVTRDYVKKQIKKKAATLIKQMVVTGSFNIPKSTREKMIGVVDTETGEVIQEGQKISEALVNATTGHAVELASEMGGGVSGKVLSGMASPAKKVIVKTAIYNALKKKLPKATSGQLEKILAKTGWNGVIGEWFEERDADIANDILYSLGLGDQNFEGLSKEDIAAELIAFGGMGAGVKVGSTAYDKLTQVQKDRVNKTQQKEGETPENFNLPEQEFKSAINLTPKDAQPTLQKATETELTSEQIYSLSPEQRVAVGLALQYAKNVESFDNGPIDYNINALKESGVNIPSITGETTTQTAPQATQAGTVAPKTETGTKTPVAETKAPEVQKPAETSTPQENEKGKTIIENGYKKILEKDGTTTYIPLTEEEKNGLKTEENVESEYKPEKSTFKGRPVETSIVKDNSDGNLYRFTISPDAKGEMMVMKEIYSPGSGQWNFANVKSLSSLEKGWKTKDKSDILKGIATEGKPENAIFQKNNPESNSSQPQGVTPTKKPTAKKAETKEKKTENKEQGKIKYVKTDAASTYKVGDVYGEKWGKEWTVLKNDGNTLKLQEKKAVTKPKKETNVGKTVSFKNEKYTVLKEWANSEGKDFAYIQNNETKKTRTESFDNIEFEKTQKEKVAEAVKGEAKTIKQISEETKILEPNVRRILGVGAKEGVFERVEKGVYVLSKDGVDTAYIQTADAIETLPKLAKEGFKSDMIFLDIPYDIPSAKGGGVNSGVGGQVGGGVKFELISVKDFGKVLDSVKEIARKDNSPIIHMFSNAPSGMKAMQKYNDLFIEKGFIPVGKGEYQKTYKDGKPVGRTTGAGYKVSKPEGIIVFTKSGKLNKSLGSLDFKFVRPKSWTKGQTQKPEALLAALINETTNPGEMVLDPFAGSGVTGVAAVKAGRKVTLLEKNKNAVENKIKPDVKKALEETQTKPRQTQTKNQDVGEKIGGAHKDRLAEVKESLSENLANEDILKLPKNKLFPELDFPSLKESGFSDSALTVVNMFVNTIGRKPSSEWKMRHWVDKVKQTRAIISEMLANKEAADKAVNRLVEGNKSYEITLEMYKEFDFINNPKVRNFEAKATANENGNNSYYLTRSGKFVSGTYTQKSTKTQFFERIAEFLNETPKVKVKHSIASGISVYTKRNRSGAFIMYVKGGKEIELAYFNSLQEARDAKKNNIDKYVKEIEAKIDFDENSFRNQENKKPEKSYRNGKNISSKKFMETFGFRGVEFGNWVNAEERVERLNMAYDSFKDLAYLMDIPEQALSLNGELAFAFGSRGRKGALAHFEPAKMVINITKNRGAGSIAHEWWHGVDNYFGRKDGGAKSSFITGTFAYSRKELSDKVSALMDVIKNSEVYTRSQKADKYKGRKYYTDPTELGARAFEVYVKEKLRQEGRSNDFLVNLNDKSQVKKEISETYPYASGSEIKTITDSMQDFVSELKIRNEQELYQRMTKEEQREIERFDKYPSSSLNEKTGKVEPDTPFKEKRISTKEALDELYTYFDKSEVDIRVAERIVAEDGGLAWGVSTNKLIAFVKNPLANTPSHEAVHTYMRLFLGQKKYDALIKYVKNKKLGNVSDLTAQEWLAENFIYHIKERKAQKKSFLTKVYEGIRHEILRFVGKEDKIADFYDAIIDRRRPLFKKYNKVEIGRRYQLKDKQEQIQNLEQEIARLEMPIQFYESEEMESNYQRFRKNFGTYIANVEDADQLKEKSKLKDSVIDDILYSQEMTGNEVFDKFKNRFAEEKFKRDTLVLVKEELDKLTGASSKLTTKKGSLRVQQVFNEAWQKLYGEEAPKSLSEMLTQKDEELFAKGARVSFAEGKKVQRIVSKEKAAVLRQKNIEKTKELRKKLRTAYKEKTASAQEIKAQVVEYVKANVPKTERGRYLTAVRDAKTANNLSKVIDKVNERREKYERQKLVKNIVSLTENIDKLPIEFQKTILAITESLELKNHTEKLLKRLRKTRAYLDTLANDFSMPRRVLNELGILKKTPFNEISTTKLMYVNNKLEQYNSVGRSIMKNRKIVKVMSKEQSLQNIKEQKGLRNLDVISLERKLNPFLKKEIKRSEKIREKFSRAAQNLMGMDRFFNLLDGRADYQGSNFKTFKEPVDAIWNKWQWSEDQIRKAFDQLILDLKLTKDNSERIAIHAYREQRGGREKLMKDLRMTAEQLDSVVLTEKEMQVYNWMRGQLDKLYGTVSKKLATENNVILGKPLNYFPMMQDYGVTEELEDTFVKEGNLRSVPFGNKEERANNASQRLKLDAFQVFDSYVGKATYFVAMDSTIRKLNAIANDPKYTEMVGEDAAKIVKGWLQVLSRKGGAIQREKGWETRLNDLNNNLTVVILGVRITTIAKQPLALLDGAAEIGTYAFSGVRDVLVKENREFMFEASSELRNRSGGETAIQEIENNPASSKLKKGAMWPIKVTDYYTAGAVWLGAYNKKLDELGIKYDTGNINQEAVKYADLVVRKTQASSAFKDLPPALVNEYRLASKLIFKFQTFVLNRWSYISQDLPDNMKNNKPKAVQQVSFLMLSMIAEAGISNLYYQMMFGGDDEDEDTGFIQKALLGILASTIQTVPGLSQLFSATKYGSNPVPVIDASNDFFRGLAGVYSAKRLDTKAKNALRSASIGFGTYLGIPTEQARVILEKLLFP